MEDKGKCMHLCDSPEILENDKVCSGSPPSQCRTQLSCGTKGCACWLKLQCNGGTGGNPSDGKVSVHTRDRRSPFIKKCVVYLAIALTTSFSAFVNIGWVLQIFRQFDLNKWLPHKIISRFFLLAWSRTRSLFTSTGRLAPRTTALNGRMWRRRGKDYFPALLNWSVLCSLSFLLFSFLLFFSFCWPGAPWLLLSLTSAVDKLATLRATYSVSQTSAPATFSIPPAVLRKVCLMWTNPSRRSPWRSLSLLIMFLWTVNQ